MVAVVVAVAVVTVAMFLPLLLSLAGQIVLFVALFGVSVATFETALDAFVVGSTLDAVLLSPVVCRCSQAFFKCLGAVAAIALTKKKQSKTSAHTHMCKKKSTIRAKEYAC